MAFAAIFSFVMPLSVGFTASWMALSDKNVGTVRDWQTLIAGLIAIVAALMGGGFVLYQTYEGRRQEHARIARHHAAARAVLPLALSGLVDYAEAVAAALEVLRRTVVSRRVMGFPGVPFVPPVFKPELIEPLRDLVESASESVGERVAKIIEDVQIMDARLRDIPRKIAPGSSSLYLEVNLNGDILLAATIFARCSDLFNYARRRTDDAPQPFPNVKSLTTALNLLGFDEWTHTELYADAVRTVEYYEGEGASA